MQAMIDELAKQAAESLGQVSSKETLASFWQEYLSKNGKIPALMKNLRSVAPEERPAMGKIINELKQSSLMILPMAGRSSGATERRFFISAGILPFLLRYSLSLIHI